MSIIKFQDLWNSHPLNQDPPEPFPCRQKDGTPSFEDQCAIKMSVALMGANMNLNACHKTKCWFGHTNHVIRAQELADWLSTGVALGAPKKYKKGNANQSDFKSLVLNDINGRSGIVFFRNFWGTGNQGDHIDVWNGIFMSGNHTHHDYAGRSEQVWFWSIGV